MLGALAWFLTADLRWLVGGVVLLANWPYTLIVIMPVNHRLNAIAPDAASPESRALILRWGTLHAGRSALGAVATLLFFWAALR